MAQTDVLIIGSGIAGLSVAIKVAEAFPDRRCMVITKQESAESNTRYAQGGIAVVSDFSQDSFQSHITDTLDAGDGLCDADVVRHVVHQAPARLRELINMGAAFDRDESGNLVLGREGGHKAYRIIHSRDVTGLNISTALLNRVKELKNVTILSHHVATDLITQTEPSEDGRKSVTCYGAYVLNVRTGSIEEYCSIFTVLATGGIGQLYATTTNPVIATGDGIAMAHRAGAQVSNMEFVQFHPTALYERQSGPAFLISEAVRGQGAFLRNSKGERFAFRYHMDGELACRDVVSRAIAAEIQSEKQPYVYLDCTHLSRETLLGHFPNILGTCLSKGIDITRDYIPVAPAAHYLCGGIDVDLSSRTTISNLYACGECSNTGLHGANRLASNSLLEATVFAHNCFEDIRKKLPRASQVGHRAQHHVSGQSSSTDELLLLKTKTHLQAMMSRHVGIVRSNEGLDSALKELLTMSETFCSTGSDLVRDPFWHEVRNMITTALLVVTHSLQRKENRGGFFNASLKASGVLNR